VLTDHFLPLHQRVTAHSQLVNLRGRDSLGNQAKTIPLGDV